MRLNKFRSKRIAVKYAFVGALNGLNFNFAAKGEITSDSSGRVLQELVHKFNIITIVYVYLVSKYLRKLCVDMPINPR